MGDRLTPDNSTSPDIIIYFGDPISAFDFQATTAFPSFKQRFNNRAHSCSGLFIKDAVLVHDVQMNMLEPSPDDSQAEVLTYVLNKLIISDIF